MAIFFGSQGKKALEVIIGAIAHSSNCDRAILFIKDKELWKPLTAHGIGEDVKADRVTFDLLSLLAADINIGKRIVGSHNEMIRLNKDLYIGRFAQGVQLISSNGATSGMVLFGSTKHTRVLSAAQKYALKTHALMLGNLIDLRTKSIAEGVSSKEDRLRLLESVVVNAHDAIIITEAEPIDEPGPRIVYCNPAFEIITGFSQSNVVGLSPRILQCAETQRSALDLIRESLSQWKPIEIELINAKADGSRFWAQLSIVPVANEMGFYTHWVSVQRDITARKESESLAEKARLEIENSRLLEVQLKERERTEAYLVFKAFHDDLTLLYNRAFIMKRLEDIFSNRLESADNEVTILFLDLDGFKDINDSMGHQAGDSLLITLAQRMQSSVRDNDVLARLGGDEFAVLLNGKNHAKSATEIAQRIVETIKKPVTIDGKKIFISGSIGIVSSNKSHLTPSDLLREADIAMYAAKRAGKGRWKFFNSSMRNDSSQLVDIHKAVRIAAQKMQFSLVYQPIINSSTGITLAVEALLKLNDEKLGDILPSTFIPILEDIGLIGDVGRWVMHRACLDYRSWQELNQSSALVLSVNVSPKELAHVGYAHQVSSILSATGFDSRFLQIEITESAFTKNPDLLIANLAKIRNLGLRVALDDFGAGVSSLSYIEKYPIDTIKMSSAFLSNIMISDRSIAIVELLIRLCMALGLEVVAEGVSSDEESAKLHSLGCYLQQGLFISEPLESQYLIHYLNSKGSQN